MKIYTKLVLDMKTLEVIKEESFEYDGPIALCEGDSDGGGESEGDSDPGGIGGVGAEGPEGMGGNESDAEGGAGSDSGGSDPGGTGGVGAEGPAGMGGSPSDAEGGAGNTESGFAGADFGEFGVGPNFAGDYADAQANVGGMAGASSVEGGAQYGDRTNWSDVSVGRDMAAALAQEKAEKAGLSPGQVNAAVSQAVSEWGDRNPAAAMSLNDLIDAVQQSKFSQAVQGLMGKAKDALGLGPDEDKGFMGGMAGPDAQGRFGGAQFGDFGVGPQSHSPSNMSAYGTGARSATSVQDRAAGVFSAHNQARSPQAFLAPFMGKVTDKAAKQAINYATFTQMGMPSAMAKEVALAGMLSNPLGLGLAPAYGAIEANFNTQNDLADLAADISMNNPDLSDQEVAEAVHEMSVDAGHEVEVGQIENAMNDEWGGGPDVSGQTTGAGDQPEGPSGFGSEPTTEGGESQNQIQQIMYDMQPLKNYWNDNFSQPSGYMQNPNVQYGQGPYSYRR
jgi:hypothetical protein